MMYTWFDTTWTEYPANIVSKVSAIGSEEEVCACESRSRPWIGGKVAVTSETSRLFSLNWTNRIWGWHVAALTPKRRKVFEWIDAIYDSLSHESHTRQWIRDANSGVLFEGMVNHCRLEILNIYIFERLQPMFEEDTGIQTFSEKSVNTSPNQNFITTTLL